MEAPIKKDVKNSDDINFDVCINDKSPPMRRDWCSTKYDGNEELLKDCEHHFCDFCCEDSLRNFLFQFINFIISC